MILPTIYKQVTVSKCQHLLIENVPQALFSVLFLAIDGGSVFVAVLNLVMPAVQIALAGLLFKPVRTAAIPALGKRLNRAMKSGNTVAAKALWEEAEIQDEWQFFALMLPQLTFFLDTTKRCGFKIKELKKTGDGPLRDQDLKKLRELKTLQRMAAVFAGQDCDIGGLEIGDSGAKVVAEALKSSMIRSLGLEDNEIGHEGAEALAEGLKSNGRLWCLDLEFNNIGDRGAEALAEGLKSNGSLERLDLQRNYIGDRGAEALAEGLKSNGSLERLDLQSNNIGDRGAEALAESLKSNNSLEELYLRNNKIQDSGAEALAESLKSNSSLEKLYLEHNSIGDRGAEAFAAGLLQNRSLTILYLSEFESGSSAWGVCLGSRRTSGRQALEEAEKIKKERGDDFEIVWRQRQNLVGVKQRRREGLATAVLDHPTV
eukprot:s677_g25.t1